MHRLCRAKGQNMRRAERADRIGSILVDLFPVLDIPLNHKDPYTLLVAVLLSAQCTDKRVNQVTPALFARADNPRDMAALGREAIREFIRPCGLSPAKSKHIEQLSRMLVEQHNGEVPQDWEALEALPGVGHKTAGVVMSQAFGEPAFPVDTHIHRLAWRWSLSSGRNVVQTERDLKKAFPMEQWGTMHLRIIYFGREYCPARGHDLGDCPICSWASPQRVWAEERRKNRRKK
jgi:endonuclease-3